MLKLNFNQINIDIIYILSHDVASESDITPCIKIDKPLVVYPFTGNEMKFIITLHKIRENLNCSHQKCNFKCLNVM